MVDKNKQLLYHLDKATSILNQYKIRVGVIANYSKNDRKKVVEGVTNADLMFIHEFGSPLNDIPKRPVLHFTIQDLRKTIVKDSVETCIKNVISGLWTEKEVELELKKLCIRIQNYARKMILDKDNRLQANAPSTIKSKGENYPLHNTSQLARSITAVLYKNDKALL